MATTPAFSSVLRSTPYCLYLFLTFIFISFNLWADSHGSVINSSPLSGYLHSTNQICEASADHPALEHFQENSHYLLPPTKKDSKKEGLCFGMACAYLQAALSEPDSRPTFSQRLQICSRPTETGWQYNNHHWDSLEAAATEAVSQYNRFRMTLGLPDSTESL
ncbi:hypothetical protein [Endozoicomonas numazuensis]|uniref:Uncharacterized protein n=1 Tax=Endozoicomonas numazuensis TaxID=1137799 RepID=A0A081NIK6_9GAMM|nr:hypothetical protein [Endozoicomonas numazuensis]KEQ18279.1 hypothetical protein GZ78_12205 [Endozoicomonas numazuensis]